MEYSTEQLNAADAFWKSVEHVVVASPSNLKKIAEGVKALGLSTDADKFERSLKISFLDLKDKGELELIEAKPVKKGSAAERLYLAGEKAQTFSKNLAEPEPEKLSLRQAAAKQAAIDNAERDLRRQADKECGVTIFRKNGSIDFRQTEEARKKARSHWHRILPSYIQEIF